jgi:hypothetical protein
MVRSMRACGLDMPRCSASSSGWRRRLSSCHRAPLILEQLVENGQIGVIGGMYDIETGIVEFYESERGVSRDDVSRLRSC